MSAVLRFDGLRVVIYSNDHRPSHVHVIGSGREAVFDLNCPAGPVALRENYGFRPAQLKRIRQQLAKQLRPLCEEWETIHGT